MTRPILSAILFASMLATSPISAADRPKYDPAKEVTLESVVLYVGDSPSGVSVIMKDRATASGQVNEIQVQLAPGNFLASEGIEIAANDTIRVVGSRVVADGAEIILAREVSAKGKTSILRDKNGVPRW